MCRELHELSSSIRGFLDESFNGHVNPNETRVFDLDYVLRKLETGGDGLKTEDDMHCLELAVAMEKYLKSQDSVKLVEIHQASSLSGGYLILREDNKKKGKEKNKEKDGKKMYIYINSLLTTKSLRSLGCS